MTGPGLALDAAAAAREVAAAALLAYDLPPGAWITPIRLTNNAVFAVRTAGAAAGAVPAYVLRVHRPGYRSAAETGSELRYVQALQRATGVPVPMPVPTRTGDLVVEVPVGEAGRAGAPRRHCDLLTWVPGRVRRPGAGLGPRSAARLGETLGRLHAFAERFAPPRGFRLPTWNGDGLFTARSPFRPGPLDALVAPADRALLRRVEAATRRVFTALGRGPAAFGLIHADYILGNCRFQGRTLGVLDFDDCGWGYFLYDLAPLLGNLSDSGACPALRRAFLAGYRLVRPLPVAHEAHLPILMAARHAASCLWAAGLARSGSGAVDAGEHIAVRLAEIRRCVALAPPHA